MRSSLKVFSRQISLAVIILSLSLALFAGTAPTPDTGSHSLVISQFYWGNGSTTNAPWGTSYVEVFNAGSQPVDLQNWTLIYSVNNDTSPTFGDTMKQWIGSVDPYGGYCPAGCQITYSQAFQASNCRDAQPGEYTKHCFLNPGQYMLIRVKSYSTTGSLKETFPLQFDLDISVSGTGSTAQPDPITGINLAPQGTSGGKIALVNSRDSAASCNYSGSYGTVMPRSSFAPAVIDLVGFSPSITPGTNCWEGTSATAPTWSNTLTPTDYSNGFVDMMNSGLKNKAAFMRTSAFAGPHDGTLQTAYGNFVVTSSPCADSDNNAADFGPVNIGLLPNGSTAGTGMVNWVLHNGQQSYDVTNTTQNYTPQPCAGRSSTPPTVTVTADKTKIDQAPGQVANVNVTIAVKPSTQPAAIFFQLSGSASGITNATFPAPNAWIDGGWDDNGDHIYTTAATVPTDNEGTLTITVNALDDAYRLGSGSATIQVRINTNRPPIATDSSVTVYRDTATQITLEVADPDNDSLSYTVTSEPTHGTVSAMSGSGVTLTYTPDGGYTGNDSFTFKVNDGQVDSNVAAVSITIPTPTNPAVSLSASPTLCLVNGTCNVALTATVTPGTDPASTGIAVSGNLSACTGGSANQAFQDSGDHLTFTASCMIPTTTAAAFTLGPVTASDSQSRTSAASGEVSVDVHSDPSVMLTANPSEFSVGGSGAVTFTATVTPGAFPASTGINVTGDMSAVGGAPNQAFTDSGDHSHFTFAGTVNTSSITTINVPAVSVADVQGGTGTSNTLALQVKPGHTSPTVVLTASKTAFVQGASGAITVTAVVTPGSNPASTGIAVQGNMSLLGGSTNQAFTDSGDHVHFTFAGTVNTGTAGTINVPAVTVSDAEGGSSTSSGVNITVHGNPSVVLTAPPTTFTGGGSGAVTLTATVTAGTFPTSTGISVTGNMSVLGGAANQAFTDNGNGTFSFSGTVSTASVGSVIVPAVTVSDAQGGSGVSSPVTLTINAPPVPVGQDQTVTAISNTALPITLSATNNPTSWNYTQPAHGTLTGTAPNVTYTSAAGFTGSDSFTFTATNLGGTSAPATVTITVSPAPPVASSQNVTASFNTALAITLSATNNPTDWNYTQPSHGTVSGTAPNVSYTPNSTYAGADSFTFTATNGGGTSAPATVNITVNKPAAPVAQGQSVNVDPNAAQTITLGATGTGTLTYVIVTNPTNGTLGMVNGNKLTYTTNSNGGTDSFTFKVVDSYGSQSSPATVSISISGYLVFNFAAGGPTSANISRGQTANFQLQLGGWNGSNATVTFTCLGVPVRSTCSISPNPMTLNGTTMQPVTVTIATMGSTGGAVGSIGTPGFGSGLPLAPMLALMGTLATIALTFKGKKQWRAAGALAGVLMMFAMTACGTSPGTTPAGSYSVDVTATSGGVSKTVTIALNVN